LACTIIDVSAAQGRPDWHSVAACRLVDGAILKATEGNGYVDPEFARNWAGASAVGLLLGTYHFAHPDFVLASDPEAEADHYVATVGVHWDVTAPMLFALDIEEARKIHAGAEFTSWCRRFVLRVEALTGLVCWIYTGGPFWDEHDGAISADDAAFFALRPLWIAAYVKDPTRYVAMTPWRGVGARMHQIAGNVKADGSPGYRYPGIVANVVDTSVFRGTIEELRALIAQPLPDQDTPIPDTIPETPDGNPAVPPADRRGKSNPRLPAVKEPGLELGDDNAPATPIRAGEGEHEP
jgi:GH25 family lysozyme M1 (1,4-beta-N-acetylmuramidase)